jgi:hypothetical protein
VRDKLPFGDLMCLVVKNLHKPYARKLSENIWMLVYVEVRKRTRKENLIFARHFLTSRLKIELINYLQKMRLTQIHDYHCIIKSPVKTMRRRNKNLQKSLKNLMFSLLILSLFIFVMNYECQNGSSLSVCVNK